MVAITGPSLSMGRGRMPWLCCFAGKKWCGWVDRCPKSVTAATVITPFSAAGALLYPAAHIMSFCVRSECTAGAEWACMNCTVHNLMVIFPPAMCGVCVYVYGCVFSLSPARWWVLVQCTETCWCMLLGAWGPTISYTIHNPTPGYLDTCWVFSVIHLYIWCVCQQSQQSGTGVRPDQSGGKTTAGKHKPTKSMRFLNTAPVLCTSKVLNK